MNFLERVYSVLLVSSSENLNRHLLQSFPGHIFSPINTVRNISVAKRAMLEQSFDFVIINSPLPDDTGLRFAIDVANNHNSIVLILMDAEKYDESFDKLVKNGVFILQKPTTISIIRIALDWIISARERIRRAEKKTLSIEEKMAEIRLVNRAKWLLISELKMTEPDAHRYIEKSAMDNCVSRKHIAEEIIKTYG